MQRLRFVWAKKRPTERGGAFGFFTSGRALGCEAMLVSEFSQVRSGQRNPDGTQVLRRWYQTR